MSLSPKNLSFIQKAGQAVHGASEAIAATVRAQAEDMVANLASQPFSVEADQGIARFKTLSRLSQGLSTVEAQMQELYALAAELASPAADVIVLPTVSRRKSVTNAAAVDVVAKPAKAGKKPKKSARKAATLTANDNKLLQFLQTALRADAVTSLTGNAMAAGSGLPLGSVGLSLKKIIAAGAVKLMGRGTYLLGSAAPAAAVQTAATGRVKAAAAGKAKTGAVARKAGAGNARATAPGKAKGKPAKKAKAAAAPASAPAADAAAADAAPV